MPTAARRVRIVRPNLPPRDGWPLNRGAPGEYHNPPQPMYREEIPHNELDPDDPHQNGMYPIDADPGDVRVPEPCWDQYPGDENEKRRYYDPARQWGDRVVMMVTDTSTIPPGAPNKSLVTGQMLDFAFALPAACMLRLSAVDISGTLVGVTAPFLFVEWTITIGVGRANQEKLVKMLVGPQNGAVVTDFLVTWPIQKLRVQAQLFDTNAGGGSPVFKVEMLAHVAPLTSTHEMVAR